MASTLAQDQVAAEWRRLIASGQPSEFFTLTARLPTSSQMFERRVKHWLNRANRSLCGRHWYKLRGPELRTCVVIETGELGRAHAHVLLAHPQRALRPKEVAWLKAIWSPLGRVDHRGVDNVEGIAHYLTKSVPAGGSPILSRRYQSQK